MSDNPSLSIAIVCEDKPDADLARTLCDRTACDHPHLDWLPEHLESNRTYIGLDNEFDFVKWASCKKLPSRAHGHFGDKPGNPDASITRKILVAIERQLPEGTIVILVRDSDNHLSERMAGICQAMKHAGYSGTIIVGMPHCNREAWVLNGYDAFDDDEAKLLKEMRKELGFDPRTKPDRLTAQSEESRKSSKRILYKLTGGDRDRERKCWEETPLDKLKERGDGSRLRDFLEQLETKLVPYFVSSH